ncbi:MAG: AAA family ATPase [Sulfobacillus sp.]
MHRVLSRARGLVPAKCRSYQIAHEVLRGPDKVCMLLGPGGCGKSYTVRKLAKLCRRARTAVALTATTGVAAFNLGTKETCGTTVHSFSGLSLGCLRMSPVELREHLVEKSRPVPGARNWRSTEVLVVDEVSMLTDRLLETLDFCARSARGVEEPFGGVRVLFVGDFRQLPPVGGRSVERHPLLRRAKSFLLDRPVRQLEDVDFFGLLSRMRLARLTEKDVSDLDSRLAARCREDLEPTKIYFANAAVEAENQRRFSEIDAPVVQSSQSTASFWERVPAAAGGSVYIPGFPDPRQQALADKFQSRSCPNLLEFKQGAQYVLTRNLDVKAGLANGSRCCFRDGELWFLSGKSVPVDDSQLRTFFYPLGGRLYVKSEQFPLRLGYATTVHSCQGMTLDCAEVDLQGQKDPRIVYVALSRVRSLSGLFLKKRLPVDKFNLVAPVKVRVRVKDRVKDKDKDKDKDTVKDTVKVRVRVRVRVRPREEDSRRLPQTAST